MRALIIGEGSAGPVAALALRKAGIDATVFEGYASAANGIGGALSIAPNGLNALRVVDAADPVIATSTPMTGMAARTNSDKAAGPVARVLRDLVMPVAMKLMAGSNRWAWQFDYRIDWDEALVTAH